MDEDLDIAESHAVDEFDRGTRIHVMTDGTLRLKFPCMPPSWATREDPFECLDQQLGDALGIPVEGLDKEYFGVYEVEPDTLARVRACLLELARQVGRG